MSELYEHNYERADRFSFGKNWQEFIQKYDEERLQRAKDSLREHLGDIRGKSFIDIGCGSGLFSLAAAELGTSTVTSVDADKNSVQATTSVMKRSKHKRWQVLHGSILNDSFVRKLGKHDIVYSWGVLHHTGNMHLAVTNATRLVKPNGKLFIAIYNDNRRVFEGTSQFWLKLKRRYNASSKLGKKLIEKIYTAYLLTGVTVSGRNPRKYVKHYSSRRGMDFHTDVRDWLGGYPYEFAKPKEIIALLSEKGFAVKKITTARSIGCNEFVFQKLRA